MRVSESAHNAAGDENGQFFGQLAAFVFQLLIELLEVRAANQLHRHEIDAVGFAEMIGLDDVGMNEVGYQLGFADEVFNELFLVGVVLADDFDRQALYELAGAVLLGFVHNTHAAFKNLPDDLVAKLILNGEESHGPMVANRVSKSSPGFPGAGEFPLFFRDFFSFSTCTKWVKGFNTKPSRMTFGKNRNDN
jgi:hypothetical protein